MCAMPACHPVLSILQGALLKAVHMSSIPEQWRQNSSSLFLLLHGDPHVFGLGFPLAETCCTVDAD